MKFWLMFTLWSLCWKQCWPPVTIYFTIEWIFIANLFLVGIGSCRQRCRYSSVLTVKNPSGRFYPYEFEALKNGIYIWLSPYRKIGVHTLSLWLISRFLSLLNTRRTNGPKLVQIETIGWWPIGPATRRCTDKFHTLVSLKLPRDGQW